MSDCIDPLLIANLTKNSVDNSYLLHIHLIGNTILCLTGIFLNILLAIIIVNYSKNLQKIRPILWFGLIVDLILATLNLFAAPVSFYLEVSHRILSPVSIKLMQGHKGMYFIDCDILVSKYPP